MELAEKRTHYKNVFHRSLQWVVCGNSEGEGLGLKSNGEKGALAGLKEEKSSHHKG